MCVGGSEKGGSCLYGDVCVGLLGRKAERAKSNGFLPPPSPVYTCVPRHTCVYTTGHALLVEELEDRGVGANGLLLRGVGGREEVHCFGGRAVSWIHVYEKQREGKVCVRQGEAKGGRALTPIQSFTTSPPLPLTIYIPVSMYLYTNIKDPYLSMRTYSCNEPSCRA